jgi:hypothetical protein
MTGFAARLRRATMTEHREAETRGFISRLLAGQVPIAGFTQLTAQYLAIYRELEAARSTAWAGPPPPSTASTRSPTRAPTRSPTATAWTPSPSPSPNWRHSPPRRGSPSP